MTIRRFSPILTVCLFGLLLGSCSASRDLPEGQLMLNKVGVVADGKYRDINPSQLKSYVRQKGNSRWFSAVKIPLGVYAMAGDDSTKWINRTLKSMGEAPVIYDTLQARLSCENLQMALQNKGYLDAQVELFADTKGKKLNAIYVLHPGTPYYIRRLNYEIQDSVIARLLRYDQHQLREKTKLNVEALNQERSRITELLQNRGYFRFHKEYIGYRIDTLQEQHLADVTLVLRPYRTNNSPDTLHTRYDIRHITYASGDPQDSVIHLRKHVLRENTFLDEGKPYSAEGLQNTYNHFGRLDAVRYTNISFQQAPDSALLDALIQLQTNKPSTISFQPEGTNTAGDLGAAASLTYQNRNLFRGSETFSVQLRGAYEAIKGLEGYSNQDFVEYSVESRLSFPRFIMPFLSRDMRRRTVATSEVSLLYDAQNRPEFHRQVLSAGWHYRWKPQRHHDQYQFDLIDLNYVFMPWISETFKREYLDNTSNYNAILRYNYEDLFIMKTGFGYGYNNGTVAVKANIETAGNLLNLGSSIFGAERDGEGHYRLFNIAYAQYVKGDVDFTRQILSYYNSQLVFHVGLGIAYPYGNSTILPFEKRYFSGGANSVRGWSVRSLGPGRYRDKDGNINFITQTGDLKLDLNLEYRAHLFWKFGGALFVDAGNIWTLRDYPSQPGGQFQLRRVLKDLAVSYGLGLRLNFDYFIIRFDLGMKAVNPAFETDDDEHFPIVHPRLSRDLAFHFAVGLPF
ncbi:MAG: BamA/TamA family outer membrane protein [Prevotella sp.]|nr:BamA/TamA family outer membrane protein [Prevotella sp.]